VSTAATAAAKERIQAKVSGKAAEPAVAATLSVSAATVQPNGTIDVTWDLGDHQRSSEDFLAIREGGATTRDEDVVIRRAWTAYTATRYASSAARGWRCLAMEPEGAATLHATMAALLLLLFVR